ncbi:DNA polymerase III subunit alpha [Mesoaciditoga lauensis]|uniref:DNA polymerase III subunit alpha n=1 Tax=Mesoaciditoga lauensis TaxID=1495039 RepID=UPI0006905F34|nr:DNA polymerase III subunit alpha [Mesoaciditoga lauensis]
MKKFVHLHLHTEYSLMDSIVRINSLMEKVKKIGMDAVAITDHGTMAGVEKFHSFAVKNGIKPLIGCEVYMAGEGRKRHHLTIIAKNKNGYFSLVKSLNNLRREDKRGFQDDDIFELKDVVVLSGCLGGKIPTAILNDNFEEAKRLIESYKERFKDDFYLELMDTGLPQQKKINAALIEFSKSYKIKLVATNDVHFLNKEDASAHGLFVSMGRNMKWDGKYAYGSNEYFLKTPDEMAEIFKDVPEAIENTLEIADKCEEYDLNPNFTLPSIYEDTKGENDCEFLRKALKSKVKEAKRWKKIESELKIIESKNFCRYFLVVSDIVKTAEKAGIVIGPGRGSAVSSNVAYSLGITTVDPMKYDLLFERFLNEYRKGDPDIDIDVEDTARNDLITKIMEKFGNDNVVQVGAYGTLGTKAVIRAVGKALDLNERVINDLAWKVSGYPSISQALKENPSLRKSLNDPMIADALKYSSFLEGLAHHRTIHAAGIVMADEAIKERMPLVWNSNSWVSEFDMDSLSELGVVKIDLLGLKTLTNIKETLGENSTRKDMNSLPIEDKSIYDLLKAGKTLGVFQLESPAATSLTKKMAPEKFDDLVALLSLNRPGPMYSGMADEYIKRKHGLSSSKDEFGLNELLKETYGMVIYQEQIMQIAKEIAGFSSADSDLFRKAISKKKSDLMEELKDKFIQGCVKKSGFDTTKAEKLFELINSFASYGFNKSHSVAYAHITAWTAYLKANKPANYLASLMNSHISDTTKLSLYANEAKKMGVDILPPDVNASKAMFSVSSNKILSGLAAIKGVGISLANDIYEERKKGIFESLEDFLARMKEARPTKRAVEALILSGALDSVCSNRKYAVENLDLIWDKAEGGLKALQQELFGGSKSSEIPSIDDYEDYNMTEKLHLQRQYFDLTTSLSNGKGFSKVLEEKEGKVTFYLSENEERFLATDGESEEEIVLPSPLPAGGPYVGIFKYANGKMILEKLLQTPDTTYIYVDNVDEIEIILSKLIDADGKKVVLKMKGISMMIENKTLSEEVTS